MRLDELETAPETTFKQLFEKTVYDEELSVWYSRLRSCWVSGRAIKVWVKLQRRIESLVEIIAADVDDCHGDSKGI